MSRFSSRSGFWFILCAGVLFGTMGIVSHLLDQLSLTTPLSIGFFRLAFAAPILLVICWRLIGRAIFKIKRRDLVIMLLLGAMSALFQAGYFGAIPYCGVTVATLVAVCTAPVLVALFSTIVVHERMTLPIVAALICAVSGTA